MVNFGLNSASILGIFLAVAGASLYFMRSFRPELSRDQDIFFAAVGLLCGFILLFQGWRLDPILQFGQFLLTAVAVAFGVETIRLRAATTEQAKRSAPTVDRDRRTSRVYRAEVDDMDPYFEQEEPTDNRRRLRGTTTEGASRYEQEEPEGSRSPKSRSSSRSRRKSRSRPTRRTTADYNYYDYDEETDDQYETPEPDLGEEDREEYLPPRRYSDEESYSTSRSRRKSRPRRRETPSRRPSSSRSSVDRSPSRRRPAPPEEDYVDYKPIDPPDDEDDPDSNNQFDY